LRRHFKDFFTIWHPKDVVGGDIYLIEEINNDELIVMVIDCTGHCVPGSFVTMLVKAVQTQIVADIESGKTEPSPALILSIFNKSIKTMLKQEKGSKSNAGFDGGILYYNKKTNVCKYAGAKTPLHIVDGDELSIIKSDRANVGYIRTKIAQTYTEYDVEIKEGTKLYITTDGIIDELNNGDNPYGKTRFHSMILENKDKPFMEQKSLLLEDFNVHRGNMEQIDDMTILGLEV